MLEEQRKILEQFVEFLNSIAIEDRNYFEDAIDNFCEFYNLSSEENKKLLRQIQYEWAKNLRYKR